MRLLKILKSQGVASNTECRKLISDGHVQVNGVVVRDPLADFAVVGTKFSVGDTSFMFREKVYIALNKPVGYECSHRPRFYPSVFSLLPNYLINRGIQAVGRLDEDTSGLLLLSDDGQFIHRYTSPKKEIIKTYRVLLKHPVNNGLMEALKEGVLLKDEAIPVRAMFCTKIDDNKLLLGISEGRYHQVKRMVAAARNRVIGLQRVAIGGMTLSPDLKDGEWRWIDDAPLLSPYSVAVDLESRLNA